MTKHEFLKHIENPFLLNENTLSEYEQLVKKYPFCSTIWLLYLKNLQLLNDIRFDELLKKAAISCPDRAKLFTLIHQQEALNYEPAIKEAEEPENVVEENSNDLQGIAVVENNDSDTLPNVESPQKASEIQQEENSETEAVPELEKQYLANAVNATILKEVSQIQSNDNTVSEKNDKTNIEEVDVPLGEKLKSNEQHSFEEWISLLNHKKEKDKGVKQPIQESKKNTIDEFDSLIAQFLEKEPKIVPKKKEFFSPVNAARLSVTENPEIVTETLALIYMQQGDFNRALRAYEKLSLKYPEKSSYFASQIKIIKQKLNKK
jgi:tetratricopeptide (TPR) repeat protein